MAYDWEVTQEELLADTLTYKEDHLNDFSKKNGRLRFSHYPQQPANSDTQTQFEYEKSLRELKRRSKYVDGLHVDQKYTTIAHFWLIKQLVNAKEWRFVTDEDLSLMNSIYRVFSREIQLGNGHHFLSKVDRTKSRKDAYQEFKEAKEKLLDWGFMNGLETKSFYELAYQKLCDVFKTHSFHRETSTGVQTYREWAKNPIEHPIASIDKGFHTVDCTTDLSTYEPEEISKMVLRVSDHTTNFFIQHIRRRLSILERPLMTARGDGKSYIYTNFNPKYAHYALTILRTYYNFCLPYKSGHSKLSLPQHKDLE